MNMRAVALGALAILMALSLAACGDPYKPVARPLPTPSPTIQFPEQVDAVRVVRTSDTPQKNLPAFDHSGNTAASVQAFYTGLRALPLYTPSGRPCPADRGVQYGIVFTYKGATVFHAIADPTGCQIVVLGGRDNRTVTDNHLWALLAAAVGVRTTAVYPLPS